MSNRPLTREERVRRDIAQDLRAIAADLALWPPTGVNLAAMLRARANAYWPEEKPVKDTAA